MKFGKRQLSMLTMWTGSLVGFGAVATSALFLFTEWQVPLQFLPIYNKKFEEDPNNK